MEVVAFYEHLYQLISHYKSEDDPGDWQDGSFRDLSYHGKAPGVPVRRGPRSTVRESASTESGLNSNTAEREIIAE